MGARVLGLAAALLALALPRAASANPLDAFGFGSRETAMGGAAAADARGVSANYYDPAGLALARRFEIAVGYLNADAQLKIDGKDSGVDPVRALVGGVVAPGTVAKVPFAFGFAFHLPDDRLSRVLALPETTPRWELYDNRNQRLYLAANLAISPWPWLQIGGGLSFLSSTSGSIDLSGQANLYTPESSQIRSSIDADLTAVRYPQAGVRVALSDRVALAVVYRGQFSLGLDLKATIHGNLSDLTTAYYALQTSSVDNFLPQQLVVGGSFDLSRRLRANVDFTWVNWSAYVPPVAHVTVALDIPPPSGGWPAGITPPTVPAATQVAPIDVHDRIVPHVGLEWRAVEKRHWAWFVRAGYEYDKSPFGAQTGVTNYVDRDRHAFSSGLGLELKDLLPELPRDLRLDVHGQLGILPMATTLKSNPADFVGDYRAGGHILNLGATLTLGF
ncbi:MAG TPA: hypothetical protein VGI39_42985 [Polyangiaceae bacterium]|jgi:long-chain fatty acid transport protein